VAKQQGRYVGQLIARLALGESRAPPFHYRDEGALATIGRHSAIADLGWIKLTGLPAWVLWGVVHIFFLIGFRNRMAVFLNWIWAWLTYGRGARLITGDTTPLTIATYPLEQSMPEQGEKRRWGLDVSVGDPSNRAAIPGRSPVE
jgi:NADH dehydrogenase